MSGVWTWDRLDRSPRGTGKMALESKMYIEIDDPARRLPLGAHPKSFSK